MPDDHEGETLFRKSTGNLRQSINFLLWPMALPVRHPQRRYFYEDDKGCFILAYRKGDDPRQFVIEYRNGDEEGRAEIALNALPSAYDLKLLYALQRPARCEKGRYVTRLCSGQELHLLMGLSGSLNDREEVRRVKDALRRWRGIVISFDGLFYDRKTKERIKDWIVFGVLDHARMTKRHGRWEIEVTFNDLFMQEHLEGFSAHLNLAVLNRLSPRAQALFRYLTGVLAEQDESKIGLEKLLGHLGLGSGDTLQNPAKQIDWVRGGLAEINDTMSATSRPYTCTVRKDGMITFRRYSRGERHRLEYQPRHRLKVEDEIAAGDERFEGPVEI